MEEHDEHAGADKRRPSKRPRVLVACQRCKSRRQKCDNASPVCSNCSRSHAACVYSENAYPSSYVKRMEERVRELEASVCLNEQQHHRRTIPDPLPNTPSSPEHPSPRQQPPTQEAPVERRTAPLAQGLGLLSSIAAAEPHYFGLSAGLSLAHFVQVAIDSGSNSADVSLPLLADRPFSNQALNANTTLAKLPSFKTGASYVQAYLSLVHPLYPFLDRISLWQLHDTLTRRQEEVPSPYPQIDVALMHLVYAIGSRCLQLLGKIDGSKGLPEGHFLSAMKAVNEELKFTSIRAIEVTLLLAIHSMRSPSGTSVWHLAGLAIRQCLELGLHKQRKVDGHDVQLDQHRKRLFWSTYIFERKTALVLGRPFALSDEEIDLDVPMNVNDNEDEERNLLAGLDMEPSLRAQERTTLSFHRSHVELYKIHTEVRLALHQLRKNTTKEQVQRRISTLFEQLESWRTQVLRTFNGHSQSPPRASRTRNGDRTRESNEGDSDSSSVDQDVHRRPVEVEKAELLLEYHKARRSLLQPLMTEGRDTFPFDTADYIACADASGQICQLYRRLHRLSPIPFSLRDLHAVFVAGFTLIYCICSCSSIYSAERASDVGACSTVLYVISEQWSSAKKYRDAFEVVAEKLMESTRKNQEPTVTVNSSYPDIPASGREVSQTMKGSSNAETTPPSNDATGLDSTLLSDFRTEYSQQPRSQPATYSTGMLTDHRETTYQGDSHLESSRNSSMGMGMELDLHLEYDLYDLGGLLSHEGLDWFTGAVL